MARRRWEMTEKRTNRSTVGTFDNISVGPEFSMQGYLQRGSKSAREREGRLFLWSSRVKLTRHVFHWFVQ